jgi:hypothetical protein
MCSVGRLEDAEFERRLREQAEQDLRTVAEAGFPVYGLSGDGPSGDAPAGRMLGGWERSGGRVVKVTLEHGRWGGAGTWVRVQSGVSDPGGWALADLVADGEGGSGGSGEFAGFEALLVVDGVALAFDGCRRGDVWAARLRQPEDAAPVLAVGQEPLRITVLGRGVPVRGIELETVGDLTPYAVGRVRAAAEAEARAAAGAAAGEQEYDGIDAHRELVERSVRHALEAGRRAREGRTPSGGPEGQDELWELAVRRQMSLAAESREEAEEAVTALVNQMIRLGECTDWFPESADGGTALEESLRYAVFGSEVASAEAQRAWGRIWDWQWGAVDASANARERVGEERAWLGEWERWRAGR